MEWCNKGRKRRKGNSKEWYKEEGKPEASKLWEWTVAGQERSHVRSEWLRRRNSWESVYAWRELEEVKERQRQVGGKIVELKEKGAEFGERKEETGTVHYEQEQKDVWLKW